MTRNNSTHLSVESLEDRVVMSSSPSSGIKYDVPPKVQTDPQVLPVTWNESMKSLRGAINEVKDLVKRQASDPTITNQIIADRVTSIVDQRITNDNDVKARNEQAQVSTQFSDWFTANRETLGGRFGGIGSTIGDEYALRAEWIWDLGVGRCDETSSIAYHILKEAGVTDVTMLYYQGGKYGIGHAFTVMGMEPKLHSGQVGPLKPANPNDPRTWDSDAYIIDGWLGKTFNRQDAYDAEWMFDHRNNDAVKSSDDNPKVYSLNRQLVAGSFGSLTEEALEIMKAKAAFKRNGLTAEIQTPSNAEAGEFLTGKAVVRVGLDFFTKVKNAAKPVTVEVLLYSGSRIVGVKTVDFKKGEYSKELVLGKEMMVQAPSDVKATMTLKLVAREKATSGKSHATEYSSKNLTVKVVPSTFLVDVRVIDDITGQPIDGARIDVMRQYQAAAVNSGSSSASGAILFKDVATKDARYLNIPTLNTPLRLNYMVNANKAGYVVAKSDLFTAPIAGQTSVITLRMVRSVDVRFKVTDYGNFPLEGAALQLTSNGEATSYRAESLGAGEFLFRGLSASRNGSLIQYRVTGNCDGYVTGNMDFSCNPQVLEQSFTLRLGIPYQPYRGGDWEWRSVVASSYSVENILVVTKLSIELHFERGAAGEITWYSMKCIVLETSYRVPDMGAFQQYGGQPPAYYQIEMGKMLYHPTARLLPHGKIRFNVEGTVLDGRVFDLPVS